MEVEFLAVPFEADAQLAHLSRTRSVDAVMSEDGDMLVVYRSRLMLNKLDSERETVNGFCWGDILEGLK